MGKARRNSLIPPRSYSCFDTRCPTKLMHTPQRLLIVIVYCYFIYVHGVSARRGDQEREAWGNVFVLFLLSCWNTLQLQSRHWKPGLPIITFDIVAYAYTLLWDNLSKNSCIRSSTFAECFVWLDITGPASWEALDAIQIPLRLSRDKASVNRFSSETHHFSCSSVSFKQQGSW